MPSEFNNSQTTKLNNKIIYSSNTNNVDMTLENVDGGVRQVIVIHDKNQPNRYRFPMYLRPDQIFKKNSDESVNVVDKNNKRKLTILKRLNRTTESYSKS